VTRLLEQNFGSPETEDLSRKINWNIFGVENVTVGFDTRRDCWVLVCARLNFWGPKTVAERLSRKIKRIFSDNLPQEIYPGEVWLEIWDVNADFLVGTRLPFCVYICKWMEARSVLGLRYFTPSKNIKLMGTRKKFNEKFKAGRLGPRDSCRAEQRECGRESLRASFAILESTPITPRLAELSNCMRSALALAHIHIKSSSTLGMSCVGGWSRRSIVLYGVATTSRLLKIIGFFCKRAL